MKAISLCGVGLGMVLLGAAPSQAQPVLFGSTGNQGGELITIDPATGAGTLVCAIGTLGPVTEIEFRDDGVLFATTGQGSSAVITIDPADCAESLVGNHPFGAVNGLEFVDQTLYGAFFAPTSFDGEAPEGSPTSLVIVNTSDGSLSSLGPMGFSPVPGLAYDAATQTMYGTGSSLQGGDALFTVNLTNGATTLIGPHGVQLGALEFGPDGVLYGGERGGGAAPEGGSARLLSVSTATGVATEIGPTGHAALSGLSFGPEGGEPALAIPALSARNLAVFGVTLLLAGWVALRRRIVPSSR